MEARGRGEARGFSEVTAPRPPDGSQRGREVGTSSHRQRPRGKQPASVSRAAAAGREGWAHGQGQGMRKKACEAGGGGRPPTPQLLRRGVGAVGGRRLDGS